MEEVAVGRLDALHAIRRDAQLADEIISRIGDEPDLVDRLMIGSEQWESVAPETPSDMARRITPDRARALLDAPPDTPTDIGLEAIVLVLGRPVLLVRDDDIDPATLPTDTWRQKLETARTALRAVLPSVGRVELDHHPRLDWGGTGWMVADDVVVTNRHVAELFARRQADAFVFRPALTGVMGARLDFCEQLDAPRPAEFRITEVLHIEDDPGPDIAFLRITWDGEPAAGIRLPLALTSDVTAGRDVAVVGYPAKDTRTRIPVEMDRIFGDIYNVKRLAPGVLVRDRDHQGHANHDCTTLGGNSGSAVIDIESGEAVALHFAGREQDRNLAVPAPLVRERLRRLRSTPPVVDVPVVIPPAVEPDPQPHADVGGREGYRADFLGPTVAHPRATGRLLDALAPVAGSDDGLLHYIHASVAMHRFRRLAICTAVNIDGRTARNVRRGGDPWKLDPRLAPELQAGNELYRNNHLDRGHLVRRLDPAWGDTFEQAEAAARDTFFYTNCAPQHAQHNQRLWLGLEDHILGNAKVHGLKLSVFSGPVFRDCDRRYREFLIPEDYWKVVALVDDETDALSATGYIVSQRDFMNDLEFAFGPFETWQVPLTTIEEQTDLDFGDLVDADPLGAVEATAAVRLLRTFDDIAL